MNGPYARRATLAFWLGVAACASVDADPQWAGRDAVVAESSAFAAPPELLAGFDALGDTGVIAKHDRVLFAMRLERHGTPRDWFLLVEALDPRVKEHKDLRGRPHAILRVRASVFDGEGRPLGVEEHLLSARDLARGLARACRGEGCEPGDELIGFDGRPGNTELCERIFADLALANLLGVIRKSPILSGILWEVVEKPSILSVLINLRVRVTRRSDFAHARPGAGFALGKRVVPTWELPVEVRVNDAPALRAIVVCTDPHSPLSLGAGVVAMSAAHPSDPEITFSMRLLAARRGAEAQPERSESTTGR